MRDKEVKGVCYVDDAVIISKHENPNDPRRLLCRFELRAERNNVMSFKKKPVTRVIAREPKPRKLTVHR